MPTPIAEVERVVAAFAESWSRHDMEEFAELFAPDAEFVNVVGMWLIIDAQNTDIIEGVVSRPQ